MNNRAYHKITDMGQGEGGLRPVSALRISDDDDEEARAWKSRYEKKDRNKKQVAKQYERRKRW